MKSTGLSLRHRRLRRDEIIQLLSSFESSGLSAVEFTARNRVHRSSFYRWLKAYGNQVDSSQIAPAEAPRPEPLALREVSLGAALGSTRWAAELIRSDGHTLRVAQDIPTWLLNRLLDVC